jgi:tetratricopeptide (TPR) repeat protein
MQQITQALDRAIELHADHEKAQLYKAQLLKRLGRPQEALRHFKRVVSINPNNLDAAREVRVANMREEQKDKSVAKGPAGLLGKLLGNSEKPPHKKK